MASRRKQSTPTNKEFQDALLEMMEKFLPIMIYTRGVTYQKYIVDFIQANAVPETAKKCNSAILNVFKAKMELIKLKKFDEDIADACSAMAWILGLAQDSCDGKLFEEMFYTFLGDGGLRDAITANYKTYDSQTKEHIVEDILLNRFFKAMVTDEITTDSSFRVEFLKNWLDTIVGLIHSSDKELIYRLDALDKVIMHLAETFSVSEQNSIFQIWYDSYKKHSPESYDPRDSVACEWWAKKLHDAIINLK